MAIVFRKKEVLSLGGWRDVQFFDMTAFLTSPNMKFKALTVPELTYTHLENPQRFTLSGFLKRKHTQGYWWHIITAPRELSAWPLKILAFSTLIILSMLKITYFFVLVLVGFIWMIFRIRSRKGRVRFCIGKFQTKKEKIAALLTIFVIFVLEDFALDLGKFHAMFSRVRTKSY